MDSDGVGPAIKGFHVVDYVIFAGVLVVSMGIGLYHAFTGGKQRTTSEIFTGNRQMSTAPVALSILVSFVSAILVLGTPAETYTRGTQLFLRTFGYCLACAVSSVLLVPLFFRLKVTSSFEYLEKRYNSKVVKLLGTGMMLIGNVFYMGLVMYTPSTALKAAVDFPLMGSILLTGMIATIYTTLGGMRAVIWTDVFQAFIMIGGMVAVVIQGTILVGGLDKVWNISMEGGRISPLNFDFDPTVRLSFWSTVVGGMFHTLTVFGVGQTSVQRYCSLPTLKQAKRSVLLNIPGLLIINILACLVGLVIYAYYTQVGCDPLRAKYISNSNQLVPYFVVDVLNYPGLPGIFLAVLFSGALSSMSSSLNAASAVTWEDILKPRFHNLSERRKALITKVLVVCYGGLGVVVAFLADGIGGHVLWASISFTGATSGPSLGMFLLGALFPWANAKGCIAGFLVASGFNLWVAVGAFITRPYAAYLDTRVANCTAPALNDSLVQFVTTSLPVTSAIPTVTDAAQMSSAATLTGLARLYGLSFLWYSAVGVIITVIVGLVVSFITGAQDPSELDPSLTIPFFDRLCCCLPARWRHSLRCGVPQQAKSVTPDSDSNAADVEPLNKCAVTFTETEMSSPKTTKSSNAAIPSAEVTTSTEQK